MTREYGQFCGLSHALDLIGGRWTLLIVRELLTGSKRFTDLEQGLPGIPSNILSTRLRELEDAGLVERRLLPRPSSGVVYTLTDYGRDLEEPLLRLGMWGARSLGAPKPDDFISCTALSIGLRAMFHPDVASGTNLTFEVLAGEQFVRGSIQKGVLDVPNHALAEVDLSITAEPVVIAALFKGFETVDEAIAAGHFPFRGSTEAARQFFEIFAIEDPPERLQEIA